ncbi:methyl-accepting chemotaxis protein [Bacillus sp. 31A1R]|uniref:Methyl-accepting chemotaxis protein n=1 Tax=Robertmurraya mangrovi TaxID=3098077 RepID=A0ABU5IYM0_9BACI|nr:methyl-accepting chemotaxis protein [Bacillus sp. 31A1R]MDZ5472263.1 methyl-accepting chemotaxis protein [Bacillus sp. 31A1R]
MNWTIRKKLISGFSIILILLVLVGGFGTFQLANVNEGYKALFDDRVSKLMLVKDLKQEMTNQTLAVRGYVISNDESHLKNYEEANNQFINKLDELKAVTTAERPKQLVEYLYILHQKFSDVMGQAISFKKVGNEDGYAMVMNTSANEVSAAFNETIEELITYQVSHMETGIESTTSEVIQTGNISLIIVIVSLVLGVVIAFMISRQITLPVQTVVQAMKEVASGNLSVSRVNVKTKDEIRQLGDAFNQMTTDLRSVVSEVRSSASSVAASSEQLTASAEESSSSSEEIAQLIQQNAEGTEQQLRLFSEIKTSMEEMASGMDQMTQNSEDMLHSTESANLITKEGAESITNVVNQMTKINESVHSTADTVRELGNQSKEIQNIVGFITQIAEQTNLLALNAAIEAARAGEHGKGFAVVADEVRKLAEESRKSAEQITGMIHKIQEETTKAVTSMEEQNQVVEEGLQFTNKAHSSFEQIENSIDVVARKVEEVSSSIEELHALSGQMVQAIEHVQSIAEAGVASSQQVSAGTQENVATIEEVTASAQSLSQLAVNLQELVARFKV